MCQWVCYSATGSQQRSHWHVCNFKWPNCELSAWVTISVSLRGSVAHTPSEQRVQFEIRAVCCFLFVFFVFFFRDWPIICEKEKKSRWKFVFCGWTVRRKGPCFLADSRWRFRWPLCVSQWHGTVAWHACEGTSSSLTSYSWFLIFSGLKTQRWDEAVGILRQGYITRHADTHTLTHTIKNLSLLIALSKSEDLISCLSLFKSI